MLLSDLQVAGHFFQRLWETPWIKALGVVCAWFYHFMFGEYRPAFEAVLVLWMLDWISGTVAAWLSPKDHVRSRRWWHSLVKLSIYLGLLCVGHQLTRVSILFVGTFLQGLLEGSIIATEALSVLENADRLGRIYGVEIPAVSPLIKFIRGRQSKSLAELADKEDKINGC